MNALTIITAAIRLWSLSYFLGAIGYILVLPSHITMSMLSSPSHEFGRNSLITDGFNMGIQLILGFILWFFSNRIATFILKSIEKE